MKKFIIFSLFLCMILCGCVKTPPSDPLAYQVYPFTAKGSISANKTDYCFELKMTDAENAEITFQSPNTLKGYLFKVGKDGSTLSYDDMTVTLGSKSEKASIITLLSSLFRLKTEDLKECENGIMQNSLKLTKAVYKTDGDDVTVYVNEETMLPECFEKSGFRVVISGFTKTDPVTDKSEKAPETAQAPSTSEKNK